MNLCKSVGWILRRKRVRPLPTTMYGSSPLFMNPRTVFWQQFICLAASPKSSSSVLALTSSRITQPRLTA
jgi:hypothetical protein